MRRGGLIVVLTAALCLSPIIWAQVVPQEIPFPDGLHDHTQPPFPLDAEYTFNLSRHLDGLTHALGLRLCKVITTSTVATLPTPVPIEPGGCAPVAVVVDASAPGDCSIGGGTQVAFCRSNGFTWGSLGGGFADTNTQTICADTPAHVTQFGDGTCADLDAIYALIGHNHTGVYSLVSHNHDSAYAAIGHNHNSTYSLLGHNHDSVYAALSHNHDTSYYLKTELNTSDGSAPNSGSNRVHWDNLNGVPAGFADGVDNTGTGSAVILDLADDGTNESTAITEFAVTGDTNGIFDEPSADKLRVRVGQAWPRADVATTADAFTADPMGCGAATWMTDQTANGTAICAGVSFGQVAGSATDSQVDNTITAGQFATDPNNCASGSVAGGVAANGDAQSCLDPLTQSEGDARYPLASTLGTNDGTANQGGDPVSFTKLKDIPGGLMLLLNAEIGPPNSGGTGFRLVRVPN